MLHTYTSPFNIVVCCQEGCLSLLLGVAHASDHRDNLYVCMYVCITYIWAFHKWDTVTFYVCMYVYLNECMYVCVYVKKRRTHITIDSIIHTYSTYKDLWIDGGQNRSGCAGFRHVVAVGDERRQGRHDRVVELWTMIHTFQYPGISHTGSVQIIWNKTMHYYYYCCYYYHNTEWHYSRSILNIYLHI